MMWCHGVPTGGATDLLNTPVFIALKNHCKDLESRTPIVPAGCQTSDCAYMGCNIVRPQRPKLLPAHQLNLPARVSASAGVSRFLSSASVIVFLSSFSRTAPSEMSSTSRFSSAAAYSSVPAPARAARARLNKPNHLMAFPTSRLLSSSRCPISALSSSRMSSSYC